MTAASWDSQAIFEYLASHPQTLEPGLILVPTPLELGSGRQVDLHGPDPLGRPCLVFFEERFEPDFFDLLVEAVTGIQAENSRVATPYQHSGQARLFVLAPALEPAHLQRLEFFARAVSLRAFTVGLARQGEERTPVLEQEFPRDSGLVSDALDGLEERAAQVVLRVFNAARVLRPPVDLRGPDEPMVLVGRRGPCATLHRDGSRLVMAAGKRVIPLMDDGAGDEAIDLLMREQWV